MQVAAAGRAADHMALNDGNRGFADRDGPADERLVGASLGRAAAALVRDLVRDDARGGRDDGDVEVAPLVLAAPRVGLPSKNSSPFNGDPVVWLWGEQAMSRESRNAKAEWRIG